MTESKRFVVGNDNGEVYIKDNLTKKYPFSYVCEEIEMMESMINECMECSNLLNQLWGQTQRFEKYSQEHLQRANELVEENEQLRNRLKDWHQKTFKAHEYFNILEEVIDEVCYDDVSNEIWKEYEKREKLIE